MARSARRHEIERPPSDRRLRLVHSRHGAPPPRPENRSIDAGRLAVVLLIASESVMFAALVVAYEVLRAGQPSWPPADLPRLPIAVSMVNTIVLLVSAATMRLATVAARRGDRVRLLRSLGATGILGTGFVLLQGSEWVRLIGRGLTLSSGVYGGTFFVLIGVHAVHVIAALLWLGLAWRWAQGGAYNQAQPQGLLTCALYWYFVCVVWLVLFPVVYLR